jgi:hypothetical protein
MLVDVPCKIGDKVWGIRRFSGFHLRAQEGTVSDILFRNDMRLCIVVKYVCRGEWGKDIFGTEKECVQEILKRQPDECPYAVSGCCQYQLKYCDAKCKGSGCNEVQNSLVGYSE